VPEAAVEIPVAKVDALVRVDKTSEELPVALEVRPVPVAVAVLEEEEELEEPLAAVGGG
jgi:hypothetical protein